MRRHDRNLFLPDRHLRQQPRIGLGEAVQIIGLIDRQRTPDETLLVDDLRLTQLFLGPDDVIHRIQLVLQLDLLGIQGFDLLAPHSHLLGQGLHLDPHLGEILPQPGNFVFLLGKLRAHVPNHLLQSVEAQIGFAQLRDSALQRSDLDFVFPQQPVDGGDIVVDLLHGTAAAFGVARHREQILTRPDQRKILGNRTDVLENSTDQRILRADDHRKRIALLLDLDDRPFAHTRRQSQRSPQRHDNYMLHNFLTFKSLFALRRQIYT